MAANLPTALELAYLKGTDLGQMAGRQGSSRYLRK